MSRIGITSIIILFSASLFSQKVAEESYWFYFTDKQNNEYSVTEPWEFLSQRSIDRRAWQSLKIDESDLPVTAVYLDSLKKLGVSIRHVSKWLNGVLITSGDIQLMDTLSELSFIDTVQWIPSGDRVYYPGIPLNERFEPANDARETYRYGLSLPQVSQVGADYLHQQGLTGQGVYISVLDVGFKSMTALPAFIDSYTNNRILATRNFVDKSADIYSSNWGHGTYVSSIIISNWTDTLIGTAPNATLILGLTENGDSETKIEEFAWIEGAEWADSLGSDIINTSLGYTEFDEESPDYTYKDMDGITPFISRASSMTARKGILCVTSAGNSGNNPWYHIGAPADALNILAVGAIDADGIIGNFSSRGPTYDRRIKPEIVAMGVGTAIQTSSGDAALGNGTSFSSPVIAGAAASLWQAFPALSVTDLIQVIIESGNRSRVPDVHYGYGIPDFEAAYHSISSAPTSVISGELKVYPNPFSEYLNIELPLFSSGLFEITIYDMQGRKIYTSVESVPVRIAATEDISSGLYILEVKNSNYSYRSRILKY